MSDDAEAVGCPKCGTILNAGAAGCDGGWHVANRAMLVDPELLARDMAENLHGAEWKLRDVFEAGRQSAAKRILARARALQADTDGDPDLAVDPMVAGEIEGLWAAVRIADERTWEQSGWRVSHG